jgi:hypothetical protein
VPAGRLAEQPDELVLVQPRDVTDRRQPPRAQLPRGRLADAPEPLERERVQELALAAGRHDEQAVGLRRPARDLRDDLARRHPDRHREADPRPHLAPQPRGDFCRRARDPLEPAHVEERLLHRHALDQRRRPLEHAEQRARLAAT